MSSNQNIRVFAETLNNLIVAVSRGEYRIPQFQREYVWEMSKVLSLFDSIYKEYPIGSLFIWNAGREHNRLFRHSVGLNIRPVRQDDHVSFILDGQQRITSLYVTVLGLTAGGADYSRVCFDAKEEKFTHREPDNKRFIRVCDIWGERALSVLGKVSDVFKPAFEHCWQILRTYPVPIVEVSDKDLPAVCNIFQRINQSGKRLDRFDLISAMTFSPDFDLRQKFKEDIISKLEQRSFGPISPAIVTQLMALIKRGSCTQKDEFSLSAEDITALWKSAVESVLLAADTLRKSVGVQNSSYLPYDALLTLLAYFYARSKQRSLGERQLSWVQRWFWRASFSQHYGSGGPTKMGQDKELFDRLIDGQFPSFETALNLTADTLVSTKMTWSRSAVRNGFLCLLAHRNPVHLVNNTPLDLVNGGISDFTSPEKHHIFPQEFLREHGTGDVEVQALANFCFLPAELNKRILADRPSNYLAQLRRENPRFEEASRSHFIPIGKESGLAEDDYLQFLKSRSELILQEIERLTGLSMAPPEDRYQQAIKRLETRLRDLIHSSLSEVYGPQYWQKAVPEDVRSQAENRIATALHKQPELKAEQFVNPREKLDFCTVSDYIKMIGLKNNWPQFERVFHRRIDFDRHLEAFSDFRNALMHNRTLTDIERRAGELAIIWLETVMHDGDTDGTDGDDVDRPE